MVALILIEFVGLDEYMASSSGTHKGRVSEVNCCEYQDFTYNDYDMYVSVMSTLILE